MRGWGLQRRTFMAQLVVALVTLAVVALAAFAFVTVRDRQKRVVNDYYQAVITSHDQFLLLVDAESAVRDYALSGDPSTLAPIAELQGNDEAGPQLRRLLGDDPEALAALQRAIDATQVWWEQWAQPTIAEVRTGGAAAVGRPQIESGQRLFAQVRADFDHYIDVVEQRRHAEADELKRASTVLFVAVLAIAVVALAGVAVLGLLLRRWVTRPVLALAEQTRGVHDGALGHRIVVQGPPEITALAGDVDDMRQGLVDQLESVRSSGARVEEAHEALEAQAAELERSNRELEQFAYVASHDLQEPLRKVASFCQLLQRRYAGQLDDRADQYIEFAVDGAKRMQQLINDLLDFSRVGRLTVPQTDVDLDDCLDRALRNLDLAIEESGAVVTRDELPTVRGEAPLLVQLLTNLVGNAVKFRGDRAPHVHIGARRDGELWELSCRDNGIGIEPQYADRVFAIFQRLHPKDVYTGTGIGLAICKKIVEYHGGRIWLDTTGPGTGEEQRGTTIRWTLPADVRDAVPDAGGDGATGGELPPSTPREYATTTGSGGPDAA